MPGEDTPPDPGSMSFEQAIEELESIIQRIEDGAVGLEASLAARKRGEALIHRCRAVLEAAEQQLEQLAPPEGRQADNGGS
jgi:exodeoxyribonuclease VII small subunit